MVRGHLSNFIVTFQFSVHIMKSLINWSLPFFNMKTKKQRSYIHWQCSSIMQATIQPYLLILRAVLNNGTCKWLSSTLHEYQNTYPIDLCNGVHPVHKHKHCTLINCWQMSGSNHIKIYQESCTKYLIPKWHPDQGCYTKVLPFEKLDYGRSFLPQSN